MNDYSRIDLFDFLAQARIKYKAKGDEAVLESCPYCEQERGKASDHFSFNIDTGQFHCVKCNIGGNLITFKRDRGYNPFEYKVYHKPSQEHARLIREQNDSYYASYSQARKIPEDVLKKYCVGLFIDPTLGPCRTYQYIDIETGEVCNIKYINKNKQMKTTANPKRVYYGLQFVDFTKEYLHICEGEDDCHSMVAIGFDNVVSIPYGAGSYSEDMGAVNKKFKKLILLFDNDRPGQEGALRFAEKAGVWKCMNCLLPFKDVRDCFINGVEFFGIQQIIDKAKRFEYNPETKERPALNIVERIERFENDARVNTYGIRFGFELFDEITGGLRGGDVVTIIANPGCFKTTMLMNLLKRSIEKTVNGIAIFFSLEMQIEAEFEREIQIITRHPKPWLMREAAYKNNEDWLSLKDGLINGVGSRLYVSEEADVPLDGIEKIVRNTEDATGEKCIIIGIDYLDFVGCKESREYDAVKHIMNGLKKKIAKKMNIPTIMLCQTNRDNKANDDEVSLRSGKGGTAIEAASDFSLGLWRNGADIIGRIVKHRRHCSYQFGEFPYFKLVKTPHGFVIDDLVLCDKPVKAEDNEM